MKTEIIIAARGELPQNLRRTINQAAAVAPVCVVFDGEESGNFLPERQPENVRWIFLKGRPRGCGKARHEGITTSKADLLVLCDGHMAFPDGWLDAIESYHAKRHKHLTCCRMQSLDQAGAPLPDNPQGGAFLALKSRETDGRYWALSAKWNDPPRDDGPVPAIMGACYAIKRKWYDAIGQPLRILNAWGGDEEILSVATHLMGGKVELLPVTVGHIYAAANKGRVKTADEKDAIRNNRHAIIDAIPMPDDERQDLHDWLSKSKGRPGAAYQQSKEVDALRKVLATGKRSWQDLKDARIVRPLTRAEQDRYLRRDRPQPAARPAPPAPENDKAQIVVRHDPVCGRCGSVNSFRQIAGRRNTGAFGIAYARCQKCGHKAQMRYIQRD